jgi:hypothetical protein
VQLALDKSGYQALMMRIVAVRMKGLMQGRTGRQRQENQKLQHEKCGQNCFYSPAKSKNPASPV